jgi:DNA replication protein DnaC
LLLCKIGRQQSEHGKGINTIEEETMEIEEAQENLLKKRAVLGIVEQTKEGKSLPIQSTLNAIVDRIGMCIKHPEEKIPCAKCEEEARSIWKREKENRLLLEEKLKREKQEYLQKIKDHPEPVLTACGVGKRYLSCSFDTFKGGDRIKEVCKSFIETPESIVLTGDTGNGKTHIAVAILRALVQAGKVVNSDGAIFTTVPDLLLSIRSGFKSSGGITQSEEDFVNSYAKIPFLILDDLGSEKSSEWSVATLTAIVDKRYREMLPTVYTTNLTLDEISEQLSRRISSRMSDAKIIKINMPDYRKKRA